jgi:hypothetical protein
MERRNFLRMLSLHSVIALPAKSLREGVSGVELPRAGHFVIVVDCEKVDVENLAEYPAGLLPEGATGGWIIPVLGNPDEAIKFYNLGVDDADKSSVSDLLPPDAIKHGGQ